MKLSLDPTDAVREVRAVLKMSQQKLASELDCSLSAVRRYERDRALPGVGPLRERFAAIAERAGVTIPNTKYTEHVNIALAEEFPELAQMEGSPIQALERVLGDSYEAVVLGMLIDLARRPEFNHPRRQGWHRARMLAHLHQLSGVGQQSEVRKALVKRSLIEQAESGKRGPDTDIWVDWRLNLDGLRSLIESHTVRGGEAG